MPDCIPVILADVVHSRRVSNFRSLRDEKLQAISAGHRHNGWVAHDYAVTAGDEFQNILRQPSSIPKVVFDLRSRFRPLDLWIAIGVGGATTLPSGSQPVNVWGTGEAFELAREAMMVLRNPKRRREPRTSYPEMSHKYRFLTELRSREPEVDAAVNIIYRLLDSLLQQTTERQWQTLNAYQDHRTVEGAAEALGVDESTASRNLSRASYWQVLDAGLVLERLLAANWT